MSVQPKLSDAPDKETLLKLYRLPPQAGQLANQIRDQFFDRIAISPIDPLPLTVEQSAPHAIFRNGTYIECDAWPQDLQNGDRLLIRTELPQPDARGQIETTQLETWIDYLFQLRHHALEENLTGSVAPYSEKPSATHRLWTIASARIVLPSSIRVEARHDKIGIRLAHVALNFGADTLSGPLEADRHLPLAGVTRPDEATVAGFRALIENSGLVPEHSLAPNSPAG